MSGRGVVVGDGELGRLLGVVRAAADVLAGDASMAPGGAWAVLWLDLAAAELSDLWDPGAVPPWDLDRVGDVGVSPAVLVAEVVEGLRAWRPVDVTADLAGTRALLAAEEALAALGRDRDGAAGGDG